MENNGNKGRTLILLIFFVAASLLLICRSLSIISSERKTYSDPVISDKLIRGTIYDRRGVPLAIDTTDSVIVISDSDKANEKAHRIAQYLEISPLLITSEIEKGRKEFAIPYGSTQPDEAQEKELSEDGIAITSRRRRAYPYSSFSSILGRAVSLTEAEGGIEEYLNSCLAASPVLSRGTSYGEDVVLTLDKDTQELLYSLLDSFHYDGDAAILNERGEILAYYGNINEKILSSVAYSHTKGSETVLFHRLSYAQGKDAVRRGSYLICTSKDDGTSDAIADAMKKKGLI